jgi:hypothetical protein
VPTPKLGYHLKDGTRVPGVTQVLGRFKESGALINWAYKRGRDGLDLYDSRDAAADIGTLAHSMVEHKITGRDPELALADAKPDYAAKARVAYSAFETWMQQTNVQPISAETPMVSESLKFGGTPDLVMRLTDGRLALGDIKTSGAVYRDYLVQVAAYAYLWNENHPEEHINGGFYILRFSKEAPDFEVRYFAELDCALDLWKRYIEAYRFDIQLKKRAA